MRLVDSSSSATVESIAIALFSSPSFFSLSSRSDFTSGGSNLKSGDGALSEDRLTLASGAVFLLRVLVPADRDVEGVFRFVALVGVGLLSATGARPVEKRAPDPGASAASFPPFLF